MLLQSKSVPQLPAGPVSVSLLLGPECRGGCTVKALLSAPRDVAPPSTSLGVPVSKLYDPLRPFSASSQIVIAIEEVRLKCRLEHA